MNIETLLNNGIKKIERKIGYEFRDTDKLICALTHSSYANETKRHFNNERLEFLGDAVLGLTIAERLFEAYPNLPEGELTRIRANVVCEHTLFECANQIDLGEFLLLGKGEEITGGRSRASILSDGYEALIAAIYLDGGLDKAKNFVLKYLNIHIENAVAGKLLLDFKTQLQELVQKIGEDNVSYDIVSEDGPDHNKCFVAQVTYKGMPGGTGAGRTKKEAEQKAAKVLLSKLLVENNEI